MKNKLIIIISIVLFIVLCTSGIAYASYSKNKKIETENKNYLNSLKSVVNDIDTEKSKISIVTLKYADNWKFVIEGGVYITKGGERLTNFNDVLKDTQDIFAKKGTLKELDDNKSKIEQKLISLNNKSKKYKDLYDLTIKIYKNYLEYEGLAEVPTGSMNSFIQKSNDLYTNIEKDTREFNIRIGK